DIERALRSRSSNVTGRAGREAPEETPALFRFSRPAPARNAGNAGRGGPARAAACDDVDPSPLRSRCKCADARDRGVTLWVTDRATSRPPGSPAATASGARP